MRRPGNIEEFRLEARKRLPSPIFHYLDGGADDETTLSRNKTAFTEVRLKPKTLVDVSSIDLTTQLFGRTMQLPFFLSPTGMSRLFHVEKERAASRAAADAGIFYGLSTLSTTSLEEIGVATDGPKLFQIYIFRDRSLTSELVERCRQAHYDALCLTVDTPMAGNRERDRRTGMTMPPRFGFKSLWSFATHPSWAVGVAAHPDFQLANLAERSNGLSREGVRPIDYVNSQFDRSVTWKDAAWLAKAWGGPLAIKGVLTVDDALRARDAGASAIIISNHGGRQLDGTPAAIEMVAEIRNALGPDMQLVVDGGIRRGSDIVKSLCLGANACSIGRPYLYGLAAAGERGVAEVISILASEIERTMTLLGCANAKALVRDYIF